MKKFSLLLLCSLSFMLNAMEYSLPTQAKIKENLTLLIKLGTSIDSANPALIIFKVFDNKMAHMPPDLDHKTFNNIFLTETVLASKILYHISGQRAYQEAQTKALMDGSKESWAAFRRLGGHLIADHIEGVSRVRFNRDMSKPQDLFTKNAGLKPELEDTKHYLEAGLIAVCALSQLQEEAIRKRNS
jgi:hypothetical protein